MTPCRRSAKPASPTGRAWLAAAPSSRRCKAPAMYSACRMARATMVSVGLAAELEVNWLPSEMNRFLTSCAWPQRFTTPSRAWALMRLVPRLWLAG